MLGNVQQLDDVDIAGYVTETWLVRGKAGTPAEAEDVAFLLPFSRTDCFQVYSEDSEPTTSVQFFAVREDGRASTAFAVWQPGVGYWFISVEK